MEGCGRIGGGLDQPSGGPTFGDAFRARRRRRRRASRQFAAEDCRVVRGHFAVALPARTDYHLLADRGELPDRLCQPSRAETAARRPPYATPPRFLMIFQRFLVGLVDFSRRNALLVVLMGTILAIFAGWYATGHLGITT